MLKWWFGGMAVMVSSARAQVFPLTTAPVGDGGRVVVVDSGGDRVKLACGRGERSIFHS